MTERDELTEAVAAYNALADELGLSRVQKLTETRRRHLRARLRDCGGLAGWETALDKIRGSPFLRGETTDFKADFDFLMRESRFTKLMEGGYDGTGADRAEQRDRDRAAAILGATSRARAP